MVLDSSKFSNYFLDVKATKIMPNFADGNNCDCLKDATVCIMRCFHNYRVFLLFDTQPV